MDESSIVKIINVRDKVCKFKIIIRPFQLYEHNLK